MSGRILRIPLLWKQRRSPRAKYWEIDGSAVNIIVVVCSICFVSFFCFLFLFCYLPFFLQKKLFPYCFRSHAQLYLFCIRRHIYWFCEYCKVSLVVFWISMLCFPVAEWILRVLVKLYAWRNSFSFKCRYLSTSVPISHFVFVGWESVLTSGSSNPRRRTRNPFLTLFVLNQGKVAIIGANVQAS